MTRIERWSMERAWLEIEPESSSVRLKCRVAGKLVDASFLLGETQMYRLREAMGQPTVKMEESTL